ncbi:unnamed protein product, partial [Prorocentrum cordatum]
GQPGDSPVGARFPAEEPRGACTPRVSRALPGPSGACTHRVSWATPLGGLACAMAVRFEVLLARLLLLLHLVRGKRGVEIVGGLFCKREWVRAFQGLLAAVKAGAVVLGKTWRQLAHAEGLNMGYSGIHPIQTLARSRQARVLFESASEAWSTVVRKILNRGYVVNTDDVLFLWESVRQKVGLALQKGCLKKAGRYTSMSLARSFAQVAGAVFHRRVAEYDARLHAAMATGQSRGRLESVGDEVGNRVFALFHLPTHASFVDMMGQLQERVRGLGCSVVHVRAPDTITWQTVLVHLCEVRQCVQKFGVRQLQELMVWLADATEEQLGGIRAYHGEIMESGYAGGSRCHAVYITEKAAAVVGYVLKKTNTPDTSADKPAMHALLLDMATHRLSPKITTLAIPEWLSMQSAAAGVLE